MKEPTSHPYEEKFQELRRLSKDILALESVDVTDRYRQFEWMRSQRQSARLRHRLMRYAALLVLPLLGSTLLLGYLYYASSKPQPQTFAEVVAAAGTVVRYELPDGSVAWLNAGTRLRYPTRLKSGTSREVHLQGEAYFEVEASQTSPFYVHTPQGVTSYVYGTRFNISAYDADDCLETVLERGKLNMRLPNHAAEEVLTPGECLSYEKATGRFTRSTVDVYEKLAWREGKLLFRNASLPEIFRRLERHYNVSIVFRNHTRRTYRYRATFRHETLPQILHYLSQSANFQWREEQQKQAPDGTLTQKRIVIDLYETLK